MKRLYLEHREVEQARDLDAVVAYAVARGGPVRQRSQPRRSVDRHDADR